MSAAALPLGGLLASLFPSDLPPVAEDFESPLTSAFDPKPVVLEDELCEDVPFTDLLVPRTGELLLTRLGEVLLCEAPPPFHPPGLVLGRLCW